MRISRFQDSVLEPGFLMCGRFIGQMIKIEELISINNKIIYTY